MRISESKGHYKRYDPSAAFEPEVRTYRAASAFANFGFAALERDDDSKKSHPALGSAGKMLLDLAHRKLDEILVDLGAQCGAQIMGVGVAQHAQRTRRCHDDERFGSAGIHRGIEMPGKTLQEPMLGLLVPIGLLHGAAPGIHRVDRAPGRVGALFARLRIFLLVNFSRFESPTFSSTSAFAPSQTTTHSPCSIFTFGMRNLPIHASNAELLDSVACGEQPARNDLSLDFRRPLENI